MALLDIDAIREILPHRYPFLLVDSILELEELRIVGIKNVTENEPFFPGHFPHHPVMPGVLIIEALAQTAAILSFLNRGSKPEQDLVYYFVGIDNARFKRPVIAGDVLLLDVTIERTSRGIWKYKAQGRVDDAVVAEADLMCTIRKTTD